MSKKYVVWVSIIAIVAVVGAMGLSRLGSAVAVWSADAPMRTIVVIDAGHGGEDGGAVSVSGLRESSLNLEISIRLNDFLHFLGIETKMIRTSDVSVCTEGDTIAQRKVSDIRNRVSMVNAIENALLLSIHQNQFSEAKYRGAQVFYAATSGSEALAKSLQDTIAAQLDRNNHRESKKAQDIYLLKHVQCPAVLVECGFLSNYDEEQLLKEAGYQKKLAAVLGCCIFQYLEAPNEI